ncbi:unnamed protein product [Rotaria sordida]|uniref:Uncharacterized protein n=1 Tax=Rotaria sordida TaxID=392033 RepID=A0A815FFP8_9BILA|nr:unnamed protein product [Rotaria sordida]CAF1586882.1 unnamed protein product [Rotaria sordida]
MCYIEKNIPSHANSHQQHILAISRNLRRYYIARILNLNATVTSERRLSTNLRNELDYKRNELDYERNELAYERNENVSLNNQLTNERLYQAEIVIDDIIVEIENKEEVVRFYLT